jgi:sortase B
MGLEDGLMNKNLRQRIILIAAVITTLGAIACAFIVVPYISDMAAYRREQASMPDISPFDAQWLEINPDYVGWLNIRGTVIDFPVVRGTDNVKYLTTSFHGEDNILGAVFMDYRCMVEDMPHIIIYGHQARNEIGERLVFGDLHDFLDEQYLAERNEIIFMSNGNLYEFEIFSARATDIYDPAYKIYFNEQDSFQDFLERNGAPQTEQIFTLSTCIGSDNDRRMIVQGALKRVVPVRIESGDDGWTIIRP